MRFNRLIMPVVVLGIIFIVSNVGFAQGVTNVFCGVSAPLGATSTATQTGHTEPVGAGAPIGTPGVSPPADGSGAVRVTCYNAGATGTTTDPGVVVMQINFGVPITNTTNHPSALSGIRLANITGDFAANIGIASVSNSAGTITLGVGSAPVSSTGSSAAPTVGAVFNAGVTSTFDILGVLVSVCGTAPCTRTAPVTASLTASVGLNTGNFPSTPPALAALSLANPANVIAAVTPGLADPTVAVSGLPASLTGAGISGGPAVLNSAGGTVKGNFTLRIQENYADMFRAATQFNGPTTNSVFPNSNTSSVQVNINLSNIPAGLNIANCSAILTDTAGAPSVGSPFLTVANVITAQQLTVSFLAPVNLQAIDVLWVTCGSTANPISLGTAATPLPSTSVAAQVTLAPIGAALSSGIGNPPLTGLTTGNVPRYQQSLQPATPITVVLFPPSNTVLLDTFAFVGPGYNTGLAIANTTVDPFGTAGGGAASSSGTVSFFMVKNDGTTKSYTTTTGSPGSGLSGAGVVSAGSTYVVNLSELLTAANFGSTFTGYVFITANFTHAHGAATIYTTTNGAQALASPVVVLPPVSTAAVRGTPEILGQ
jgi:hypothetical protein